MHERNPQDMMVGRHRNEDVALRNGMAVAEAAWLPTDPPWYLAAVARAPIESMIVGLGLVLAGLGGLLFFVRHVRGVLSAGRALSSLTGKAN